MPKTKGKEQDYVNAICKIFLNFEIFKNLEILQIL